MPKLSIKAGTTSKSVGIVVLNSSLSTGAGLTGLAFGTSGLIAYWWQPGVTAPAAITLVTQTITGAYSSGGFVEADATHTPGHYRLDIPNACLTGATDVIIELNGATNMAPVRLEIELTATDNQDAVRGGMSALPNAAANAANGLITAGTGTNQINLTSGGVDLQTILTHAPTTTTNGILDVNVKNYNNHTALTDGNNLPEVDVVDIAGTASAGTAGYVGIDWGAIHAPTSTVNLSGTTIPVSNTYIRQNTAQAGAAGTITLDSSASATDNFYRDDLILLTGGTGIGQVRPVISYVGSTKVATISPNWVINPDNTSTFTILPGVQHILAPTGLDQITAWSAACTARQALFLSAAGIFGQISGLPTSPATVLGLDASTTTAVVHFDSNDNRTSITLTLP